MAVGQLFSPRVGYAVHALCYMATKAPHSGLTTARELSEWMQGIWPAASASCLANVIQRLVRGSVLVSQAGKAGGYRFERNPDEITLCDVVALLEGYTYARCILTPTGKCSVQHQCKNYHKLYQLHQRYTDMLAEVTIAELACEMAAPVRESVCALTSVSAPPGDLPSPHKSQESLR